MPSQSIRPLNEVLGALPGTNLDWQIWNRLLGEAQARFVRLEILRDGLEAAYAQSADIALERINQVLGPAIASVQEALDGLNEQIEGANEQLTEASDNAIALIQPAIDGKIADLTAALNAFDTAAGILVSDINAAVSAALAPVPGAVTNANNATTAANDAAALANAAALLNSYTGFRPYIRTAADVTAVAGQRIEVDTSAADRTITLPETPAQGATVTGIRRGEYNLIFARNGQTIMGLSENLTGDIDNAAYELTFSGVTWRWTAWSVF